MISPRTITVFISSSISELGSERMKLVNSISQDIGNLFEKDNISVRFISPDDIVSWNEPFQESIERTMHNCDVFLFLFKQRVGEYTIREFEVARSLKKPLFVYFLHGSEEEETKELRFFQNRLNTEGFFWNECETIGEIKYRFALHLLKLMNTTDKENSKAEIITDDIDFRKYEKSKNQVDKTRKQVHQSIEKLLKMIDSLKSDPKDSISATNSHIIKLYEKADLFASETDYDKNKHYKLLSNYIEFLKNHGLFNDAVKVCIRQIAMAEELYGRESEMTAISYNNLGELYHNTGNYSMALDYHLKALEIDAKVLGTNHINTAIDYNNIGSVNDDLGDYNKALEYYQKALAIKKINLGTEHPDIAVSYNNIGMIYYSLGYYSRALEYNYKALELFEKYYGKEHPAVATAYSNIGLVYHALADYSKALVYYQKSLLINERVFGEHHPATATLFNNIGGIYYMQNDYEKALDCFQRALNIRESILGEDHPDTAVSYNNIGMVYRNLLNPKAEEYIQKATTIREKNKVL